MKPFTMLMHRSTMIREQKLNTINYIRHWQVFTSANFVLDSCQGTGDVMEGVNTDTWGILYILFLYPVSFRT